MFHESRLFKYKIQFAVEKKTLSSYLEKFLLCLSKNKKKLVIQFPDMEIVF